MPLYEYRCNECNQRFEALVRVQDEGTVACRSCSGTNVRRLISSFAMVGGYDDQLVAGESAGGGCCGGSCGCSH